MNLIKLLFLVQLVHVINIYGQSFDITGTISTPSVVVKNANITFIDINDTTKKIISITGEQGNYKLDSVTGLEEKVSTLPTAFELAQNYPNPFTNETLIPYKLNKRENVRVKIYNTLGQEVRAFWIGKKGASTHNTRWDGKVNYRKKMSCWNSI